MKRPYLRANDGLPESTRARCPICKGTLVTFTHGNRRLYPMHGPRWGDWCEGSAWLVEADEVIR